MSIEHLINMSFENVVICYDAILLNLKLRYFSNSIWNEKSNEVKFTLFINCIDKDNRDLLFDIYICDICDLLIYYYVYNIIFLCNIFIYI